MASLGLRQNTRTNRESYFRRSPTPTPARSMARKWRERACRSARGLPPALLKGQIRKASVSAPRQVDSGLPNDGQFRLIARRQVEHRPTDQRVGVIGDIAGIIALDHRDAGVMAGSDDAHRDAGEQLPDDAAMAQGVHRNFGRILAAGSRYSPERIGLVRSFPRLTAWPGE